MNKLDSQLRSFGQQVQPLLRQPADPLLAAAFVAFNTMGSLAVLVLLALGKTDLSLAIGSSLAVVEILNIARQTIHLKVPICALLAVMGPAGLLLRAFLH